MNGLIFKDTDSNESQPRLRVRRGWSKLLSADSILIDKVSEIRPLECGFLYCIFPLEEMLISFAFSPEIQHQKTTVNI